MLSKKINSILKEIENGSVIKLYAYFSASEEDKIKVLYFFKKQKKCKELFFKEEVTIQPTSIYISSNNIILENEENKITVQ